MAERVFVAGHQGMVGSALVRRLQRSSVEVITATRDELDLLDRCATFRFFEKNSPDVVFLAAARVGGILANHTRPAEFIAENLRIQQNVIDASLDISVNKFVFLGSSCIYPRRAPLPLREDSLLSGPLEPTNQWYAIAKIAGIKLCEAYRLQYGFRAISLLPTNLYGPQDNFDPQSSHVLPALVRKFSEAVRYDHPSVTLWGTGRPRREFLHVDDLADACVYLSREYDDIAPINVGTGSDRSIADTARLCAELAGFDGEILYDHSKPDGTPRKLLDVGKLSALGWTPTITLRDGLRSTFDWYAENISKDAACSVVV